MFYLVSGSRDFPDESFVRATIRQHLRSCDKLMHGGPRGVDSWCVEEARQMGAQVLTRLADWHRYGRAAGVVRNIAMLDEVTASEEPYRILIFRNGRSPGTRHFL